MLPRTQSFQKAGMTQVVDLERATCVRTMFARVAKYYDWMNRVLSAGQDVRWRRHVIDMTHLSSANKLLDIGTGTGDLVRESLRRHDLALAVGGDFAVEMICQGKTRKGSEHIRWVNTNALDLPFPSASFDAVTSGYLLRNVTDLRRALAEQCRVLKPGGYAVCLDTTPPSSNWHHWPVRFYLHMIVPMIGQLLAGETDAYRYLSESTVRFLRAEELADCMQQVGFRGVQFRRFMFGTMAIHWGYK
jgi:demethylmenaquinone methyltransferase/2-methoxy-6-polyprenyl-1,4-benzoquinol methylase